MIFYLLNRFSVCLATKYILSDHRLDYKCRLQQLHLLPLSMILEISDVLFLVRSVQSPTPGFDILDYLSFSKFS